MARVALDTPTVETDLSDPVFQAFTLLRVGFTLAPIAFGLDKFLGLMTDWPAYLWPSVAGVVPVGAGEVMLAVGVVEIAAGVLVAVRPRIGGWVVAAWLATIIANLVLLGDFHDVALRDVGLLLGAVSLARLAVAFPRAGLLGGQRR